MTLWQKNHRFLRVKKTLRIISSGCCVIQNGLGEFKFCFSRPKPLTKTLEIEQLPMDSVSPLSSVSENCLEHEKYQYPVTFPQCSAKLKVGSWESSYEEKE